MYGRRGVDSTNRAARSRLRWWTTVPGLSDKPLGQVLD